MSDATRKAVVTLVQIQAALLEMNTLRSEIGLPVDGTFFGRGNRGQGWALYVDEKPTSAVVKTYDKKEDAYLEYSRFVEIGNTVLGASHVKVVKPAKATDETAAEPAE